MIKSLKLIDGDNFVVGNEVRTGVTIYHISKEESQYVVQLSNEEFFDVPITSVLFARRIPNEETK
jgi:hypothetical protein